MLAQRTANVEASDETQIRRSIASLVSPIVMKLRKDIDSVQALESPDATAVNAGETQRSLRQVARRAKLN